MARIHWRYYQPGSTASGDEKGSNSDEEYGDNAFISFTPIETRCEQLYERGLELTSRGELSDALACFLECLSGMQECQYFAKLPQTLHELAAVYHSLGHYEKAVEFVQAEKLFYEAVIIDMEEEARDDESNVGAFPSIGGGRKGQTRRKSEPEDYGDLLIKKADEFDKLSRVCTREKQPELALDYCGKAVKIRQSVFGSEHPSTLALLEHFTVLYAQVGQKQYASAFHQASVEPASSHPTETTSNTQSTHESVDKETDLNTCSVNQGADDWNTSKCVDSVCNGATDVPALEDKGTFCVNTTSTDKAVLTNTSAEKTQKEDSGMGEFEEPLIQFTQEMQAASTKQGMDTSSSNECGMHVETPTVNATQNKETEDHSSKRNTNNLHTIFTQPLQLTQPLHNSTGGSALQTAKGICPPLWVFLIAVLVQILLVVFLMS